MSVTIRDVARHAGVSISTVSRVLNDTCPVHEDKRRLVLDASDALGYSPNPAALSLLNKKTGGLGVLLPFVSGEFFSELLGGLDEAAQDLGLFLVVSTSHRHPAEFRKAIQVMNKRVDGLIVMAPGLDDAAAASILKTGTPSVFINTYAEGLSADVLNFDNHAGAYALTRHLLDAGHERIALIRGASEAGDAQERIRGYRDAMGEAGTADTAHLEVEGGYSREDGYEAARDIAAMSPRPTAIVAANDYCAMGALSALHDLGIAVPDEIAVAGFDGLTSSQYTVPPLTTVRVPIRDIGYRAVGLLADRLRGEDTPRERQVFPVELITRTSSGAAAPASE